MLSNLLADGYGEIELFQPSLVPVRPQVFQGVGQGLLMPFKLALAFRQVFDRAVESRPSVLQSADIG